MRPPCIACNGEIPCPPPDEPDRPEAWHTSVFVGEREFFIHSKCYQDVGALGARAFAVARLGT